VLRAQVDRRWPDRHRSSDGIMGDARHRAGASDHNRGDAIDLTHSPEHGFDSRALAELLRHQMSHNAAGRITYIISNSAICSPRDGWKWRRYDGANPHKNHVHISIKAALRGEVRPWKIE
jgi:hypothetical protein